MTTENPLQALLDQVVESALVNPDAVVTLRGLDGLLTAALATPRRVSPAAPLVPGTDVDAHPSDPASPHHGDYLATLDNIADDLDVMGVRYAGREFDPDERRNFLVDLIAYEAGVHPVGHPVGTALPDVDTVEAAGLGRRLFRGAPITWRDVALAYAQREAQSAVDESGKVLADVELTGGGRARVLDQGSDTGYLLAWDDGVANEWSAEYPDVSTTMLALAAVVRIAETGGRRGMVVTADEFPEYATRLFDGMLS